MAIVIDSANGISLPQGSVSNPSLKSTDTDTGFYFTSNVISVTVDGSEIATISSSGIQQSGADILTSSDVDVANVLVSANIGTSVQAYDADTAKLDVAQSYSAKQTFLSVSETKVTVSANTIDLDLGNYFEKTLSADVTFEVANVASSNTVSSFVLDLTNGGDYTVTWFANTTWNAATAPTLTSGGVDTLAFFTYDNGTTWRAFVLGQGMAAAA